MNFYLMGSDVGSLSSALILKTSVCKGASTLTPAVFVLSVK